MADFIREQYSLGFFTAEEVRSFAPLFITNEKAAEIVRDAK